jgi:hypothetical protein
MGGNNFTYFFIYYVKTLKLIPLQKTLKLKPLQKAIAIPQHTMLYGKLFYNAIPFYNALLYNAFVG